MLPELPTTQDLLKDDECDYTQAQLIQKWGSQKIPADNVPVHLNGPLTPVSCPRKSQVDGFMKLHLADTTGKTVGCGTGTRSYNTVT